MFHAAIILIIIALVAVFSVQNADPVKFTFIFWKFEASLAIVIFLSVLAGLIAGIIIAFLLRVKTKKPFETKRKI